MVESFGLSEAGPVRSNNEDCFLIDHDLSLFIVADGMGGHAAGEVAARLAVASIEHGLRHPEVAAANGCGCAPDDTLSPAGNRLRTAITLANWRVVRASEDHGEYAGMGTTVVCALLTGSRLSIGHAGDSRLYVLSEGVLTAQTRDDTWAATVLGVENADGRHLACHPMRNVLTNVIGGGEDVHVHLSEREMAPGEMLLLCSDGVHGTLGDLELASLMRQDAPVETVTRAIVTAALDAGSRDNVTALVVRYLGG